jgi:ubiquinol-cytochrome c reductase iron-sulfur subunit
VFRLLKRELLKGLFKALSAVLGVAVLYVLADFAIDIRPPRVQSSYQFKIKTLTPDMPVLLRQDNLVVVVIARSAASITGLQRTTANLQDPASRRSNQPAFATNALRSRQAEYFVSYAIGTHLGCVIEAFERGLREICSNARYDYAGRALQGENKFQNLAIPNYNFSNDFNTLTIKP